MKPINNLTEQEYKLGAASRTEAAMYALRNGLFSN